MDQDAGFFNFVGVVRGVSVCIGIVTRTIFSFTHSCPVTRIKRRTTVAGMCDLKYTYNNAITQYQTLMDEGGFQRWLTAKRTNKLCHITAGVWTLIIF